MAARAGTRGYLQLGDNFDSPSPRWRQAVVIRGEEGWVKTLVKSTTEEVEKSQLSSVVVREICFCLVEAAVEQLRVAAPLEALELGVENKDLLAAGRAALESEDELVFATASDEFARKKTKKKAKEASSSRSEEEDGASSALLQDLRKKWLGDGTRKDKKHSVVEDSPRRRSKRFSLIEKGK